VRNTGNGSSVLFGRGNPGGDHRIPDAVRMLVSLTAIRRDHRRQHTDASRTPNML
jgi:hypothetical protein